MNKYITLLFLLTLAACSSYPQTALVATPEVPKITWIHPSNAANDAETHCFIIKFYSDDAHENELLDKMLADKKISSVINSFYVPIYWDDNFKRREALFGLNDSFAGLMVIPLKEQWTLVIEVDTRYDDYFSLGHGAYKATYDYLTSFNCPKYE